MDSPILMVDFRDRIMLCSRGLQTCILSSNTLQPSKAQLQRRPVIPAPSLFVEKCTSMSDPASEVRARPGPWSFVVGGGPANQVCRPKISDPPMNMRMCSAGIKPYGSLWPKRRHRMGDGVGKFSGYPSGPSKSFGATQAT